MFSSAAVGADIRHFVVKAPVEGGDTAIPRFLFQANIVRGVAVSGQVSWPVTVDAGATVGGGFNRAAGASSRAAA